MQKIKTKYIIEQIVQRIENHFDPDKIILFGSYAYGQPGYNSDIDILVIKDLEKNKVRRSRILVKKYLRDLMLENDMDIDVIIDSWQRIQDRIKDKEDLFLKEITENGKVIYAK